MFIKDALTEDIVKKMRVNAVIYSLLKNVILIVKIAICLYELEKKINEDGTLVTKEYVKGRENIYTHPAIAEYNKTSTSANQTVATLIKIIKSLRSDEENVESDDELLSALGIKC